MAPIHIVGQGAIGSVLFARLLKANRSVTAHVRGSASRVESVTLMDNSSTMLPSPLTRMPVLPEHSIVLVPVKAYQLLEALTDIVPYLTPAHSVVVLHNGMLDNANIDKAIPGIPWFRAITSQAAKKTGTHVQQTGLGEAQIGLMNAKAISSKDTSARLAWLKHNLAPCLDPLSITDNIQDAAWRKLIVNSVINPLTALHQIKNGELQAPQYATIIKQLVFEACSVANSASVPIKPSEALEHVESVIKSTAENYSSMHQDVFYKRSTELDHINGFIIRSGKQFGIDVTVNENLCNELFCKISQTMNAPNWCKHR